MFWGRRGPGWGWGGHHRWMMGRPGWGWGPGWGMGWGYGRGWGYGPGWGYRGGCLPFGGCFPFFLLALLPLVAFSLARLGRRHRSPRGD